MIHDSRKSQWKWSLITTIVIICRIFRKLRNKSGMVMVSDVKTQKSSESHPASRKITGSGPRAELNLFPAVVISEIFSPEKWGLTGPHWLRNATPTITAMPLWNFVFGIRDKKRRLVRAKSPAVLESYELTNIMTDSSSSRWLAASWSGTWPGCWPPPWPCTGSSMATCSGATPSSPSASVSSSPAWWAGWEGPASPSVLWGEVARQLS